MSTTAVLKSPPPPPPDPSEEASKAPMESQAVSQETEDPPMMNGGASLPSSSQVDAGVTEERNVNGALPVETKQPSMDDHAMEDAASQQAASNKQPESATMQGETKQDDPMDGDAATTDPPPAASKSRPVSMSLGGGEDAPEKDAMKSVSVENGMINGVNAAGVSAASAAPPALKPAPKKTAPEVIDLLDSDDDDDDLIHDAMRANLQRAKRQRTDGAQPPTAGVPIQPGQSLKDRMDAGVVNRMQQLYPQQPLAPPQPLPAAMPGMAPPPQQQVLPQRFDVPAYERRAVGFVPTWMNMVPLSPAPAAAPVARASPYKKFVLSVLNVNEFTIAGLPVSFDGPPTSLTGLRAPIKKVSREHGKAVYQKNKEGGGKWRIPLGAYQAFHAYLSSLPHTQVIGIDPMQLKIASLERARQEKGYPEVETIVKKGVPPGLARTLAPFQRGGVDFILEKNGRALIADDMGLGKTIQAVAAMAVYSEEWPVLVLTPSSARYHWANEFKNWLGVGSKANTVPEGEEQADALTTETDRNEFQLLDESEINVLTSSKVEVLPNETTRVVVCSYGLVPALVEAGKIFPGLFKCAIVDESHMLKNKNSKRTQALTPILCGAGRCVLLSGTPALARPAELWPQLVVLGAEQHAAWRDESEFVDKYVKRAGARLRAELHTMLTGTVMIRRLKNDVLKTLPQKLREKATVHVLAAEQHKEFSDLLSRLRQGKGALGKIARKHHEEEQDKAAEDENAQSPSQNDDHAAVTTSTTVTSEVASAAASTNQTDPAQSTVASLAAASATQNSPVQQTAAEVAQRLAAAELELKQQFEQQFIAGKAQIAQSVLAVADPTQRSLVANQMERDWQNKMNIAFQQQLLQIRSSIQTQVAPPTLTPEQEEHNRRTQVLSTLYGRTGDVKIPLVVDMLKRWLADPTKGKLCIFAHHISVLNALRDLAKLSNEEGSTSKYIRIDGSTPPKVRQQQINDFQTDPSIRIALLGITAAGVSVTLTASSTVWFAELFWTPAIMIQAEDRCHRIGQQARVKCLFFVAKGTLDDILFRLLEKKLQDIGEFVEGKEKQKLVVHKTYSTTKELHAMFDIPGEGESGDDEMDDTDDLGELVDLDGELVHDIEELGAEEQQMLRAAQADDEDGDNNGSPSDDRKMPAVDLSGEAGHGRTEAEAIVLDDDDDDDDVVPSSEPVSLLSDDEKTPSDVEALDDDESPGEDVEKENGETSGDVEMLPENKKTTVEVDGISDKPSAVAAPEGGKATMKDPPSAAPDDETQPPEETVVSPTGGPTATNGAGQENPPPASTVPVAGEGGVSEATKSVPSGAPDDEEKPSTPVGSGGERGDSEASKPEAVAAPSAVARNEPSPFDWVKNFDRLAPMPGLRTYKIIIQGPRIGVEVRPFHRRVIIGYPSPERVAKLGIHSKPAFGDILVAVNGHALPLLRDWDEFVVFLKKVLQRSVLFTFAEDPVFTKRYLALRQVEQAKEAAKQNAPAAATVPDQAGRAKTNEVIDLLDDDSD